MAFIWDSVILKIYNSSENKSQLDLYFEFCPLLNLFQSDQSCETSHLSHE